MDNEELIEFTVGPREKGDPPEGGDAPVFRIGWNFNALCEAEAMTGQNLLQWDFSTASAQKLRGLLYAGLKAVWQDVSIEDAGRLLTRNFGAVCRALAELYDGMVPEGAPGLEAQEAAVG